MAEVKLTEDQKKVVDTRDCSLLVAAAAGSGKTAVLVKRIIDRLLSKDKPFDLERMLIVTFTKAAAGEMRERIGAALEKAIKADPDNEYLKNQAAVLPNAKISTIDSFCNMVVKENFQELDLDPGFSIADENELALLKEDILNELFEEEYTKKNADFMEFLSAYSSYRDDGDARKMILDLFRFADNDPFPAEWLTKCERSYDNGHLPNEIIDSVLADFSEFLRDCMRQCEVMKEQCEKYGFTGYAKTYDLDRDLYEKFLHYAKDFDNVVREIHQPKIFSTLSSASNKDCVEEMKEILKATRDAMKKKFSEQYGNKIFFAPIEVQNTIFMRTKTPVTTLIRLTREFTERYAAAKKEKNSYGFSDIAHFAHDILCTKNSDGEVVPTAIASEMAMNYDEIMIDEYQDSSEIQENLLKCISGEFGENTPNMFMVGDVKQSIYSFRQARPDLFNGKYESYGDEGEHRKIDLSKNFRSRKAVLDSVNVLLSPIMRKTLTEVEYDDAAALYFGSNKYEPDNACNNTEFILIEKTMEGDPKKKSHRDEDGDSGEDDETEEGQEQEAISLDGGRLTDLEREAMVVGRKIREIMDSEFRISLGKDEKTGEHQSRPAEFGDFCILLRKTKGVSDVFVRVLEKMGIPADAELAKGFYETVEIMKTLSFLRILDNPFDDIPFASVLYSPYGGYSADELARLRLNYVACGEKKKQRMLYECMKMSAEDGDAKAQKFLTLYDEIKALTETQTVHEVIETLYAKTGYKDFVTTLPQGERRRGNLELLVAQAKKYEKSSYVGLHDFLRYIDRLLKSAQDSGEATLESTGNKVKIMSIHKSKGLEFPVVFVSCSGANFNRQDTKAAAMFNRDLGIGTNYVDGKIRTKRSTLKQKVLQKIKKMEIISEELRILYVAMTRAEEKLIITSSVSKLKDTCVDWCNVVLNNGQFSKSLTEKTKNFMDYMGPTLFSGIETADFLMNFEKGKMIRTITSSTGANSFTSDLGISFVTLTEEEISGDWAAGYPSLGAEVSVDMNTEGVKEELEAQKGFVYPFEEEAGAPARVSVSELKHIEMENFFAKMKEDSEESEETEEETMFAEVAEVDAENKNLLLPSFMKEKTEEGVSGALRGTLFHEVFEKLRYEGDFSTPEAAWESVSADVTGLLEMGCLEKDILETVSLKKITAFTQTAVGQRMIAAEKEGRLHREQPFVYGLSDKEYRYYSKSEKKTEMVMVQGIIDAWFSEEDGLVLVDYKTDSVKEDAVLELTGKYRVQLELYAKALERLTGIPVKEKIIYSVSKNLEIKL